MGVELARSLFMGIHLKLAPSNWVLYLIKNKVGLYAVSTLRSLINIRFKQHSTKDNQLDCKDFNKSVSKYNSLIFINELLDNMYE